MGVSVVNALSSHLEVQVWRLQKRHSQKFSQGVPVGELVTVPSEQNDRTGTSVTFLPDTAIFLNALNLTILP